MVISGSQHALCIDLSLLLTDMSSILNVIYLNEEGASFLWNLILVQIETFGSQ